MNHDAKRRTLLEAALSAVDAAKALLTAELAAADPVDGAASEFLNSKQTLERYNVGHDGLLNAAKRGLQLVRGPRNQLLVERTELERYLRSRPLQPRKAEPAPETSMEDFDRHVLRTLQGGKR